MRGRLTAAAVQRVARALFMIGVAVGAYVALSIFDHAARADDGLTGRLGNVDPLAAVEKSNSGQGAVDQHVNKKHVVKKRVVKKRVVNLDAINQNVAKRHVDNKRASSQRVHTRHAVNTIKSTRHVAKRQVVNTHAANQHVNKRHAAKKHESSQHATQRHGVNKRTNQHVVNKRTINQHVPARNVVNKHAVKAHAGKADVVARKVAPVRAETSKARKRTAINISATINTSTATSTSTAISASTAIGTSSANGVGAVRDFLNGTISESPVADQLNDVSLSAELDALTPPLTVIVKYPFSAVLRSGDVLQASFSTPTVTTPLVTLRPSSSALIPLPHPLATPGTPTTATAVIASVPHTAAGNPAQPVATPTDYGTAPHEPFGTHLHHVAPAEPSHVTTAPTDPVNLGAPGGTATAGGDSPHPGNPRHPSDQTAGAAHLRDSGGGSAPLLGTLASAWCPHIPPRAVRTPADVSTPGRTTRYCGPPS
ncbi:hypothetical protein AB0C07_29490 [Actinoplanes missouriensis]|uniref:hypothetical protein n=1 Tax=Actinoplanes missouriensis TaxID=1866 RepID=UPI003401056F